RTRSAIPPNGAAGGDREADLSVGEAATNRLRSTRRVWLPLFAAILMAFAATRVEAQSAVRRSAGTMKRSAGPVQRGSAARRPASLRASSRGLQDPTASANADDATEDRDDVADDGTPSAETASGAGSDGGDEAPVDFEDRTLGRACMYGARGEVIYRPTGARCRGDAPSARRASTEPSPPAAPRAAPPPPTTPMTGPAPARLPAASADPAATSGHCLYGPKGRVLHRPPGAVCDR
ncbi:MAG: hypothetical protein R3E53_22020, partial [Myxococcota bacterium]